MRIDGKTIAEDILTKLTREITNLKKRGVTPTLAVVIVGDNPVNLAYIKQKQKAAEKIGARVIVTNSIADLQSLNSDPNIHGIIVQRPVPEGVGEYHVTPKKDVDGFEPNSPFDVPVVLAVWKLIESTGQTPKKLVVIGRGETAGAPIARYLNRRFATSPDVATTSNGFATSPRERRDNQQCATSVIHSKTPNPTELMKQADCIISCVGKERVVTADAIKPGAILIGVGIWRDDSGKLRGDYNEAEIEKIASYYTPTPGGVGPVNVACLMQNLVKSASK